MNNRYAMIGATGFRYPHLKEMIGRPVLQVLLKHEQQRAPYELFVKDNLLCDARGRPLQNDFSPNRLKLDFVMSPSGRIFAAHMDSIREYEYFNHSSFLGGGPVAAAGRMIVVKGRMLTHDNESGSYEPEIKHLMQFEQELRWRGMTFTSIRKNFWDQLRKDIGA